VSFAPTIFRFDYTPYKTVREVAAIARRTVVSKNNDSWFVEMDLVT
jgi:hypothetical protein